MLNLPENVDEFDYNLKLAVDCIPTEEDMKQKPVPVEKPKELSNNDCKIEFPPDAFLMVTQMNWEEDVIWNGDDIKHKVLSLVLVIFYKCVTIYTLYKDRNNVKI